MNSFITKYQSDVTGTLSGFDRLVFRGTLRSLAVKSGMADYLYRAGVYLKDFGEFAQLKSKQLKAASIAEAQRLSRPVVYLPSSATSKEETALEIAERDGITKGLIGVLTSVEPCLSYDIYRNREKKHIELVTRWRKCLFLYHYWFDEVFGFMNARIQSWFPFSIQLCLNGREWLSSQMDAASIDYERRDNCFARIEDCERAQTLMNEQLSADWPRLLSGIAARVNPAHQQILGSYQCDYYWSIHQSEWATDLMFRTPKALAAIYPQLARGAISCFGSHDVLRFLGKKPNPNLRCAVTSSYRRRPEGLRLKHTVKDNSVKMYDKQGSVLRVETTLNNVRDFKTFDPHCRNSWRPMRKGISDLHRRCQVSQACNDRYLDALASLNADAGVLNSVAPVCQRVRWKKQHVRGLRPWGEDQPLIETIARAEFTINGLRNKDLAALLLPKPSSDKERRQSTARVTTKLRMLRAHRLIRKVPRTHRYVLSRKGRLICTAILHAQNLSVAELTKQAA